MTRRMGMVLLALLGLFISTYLTLYHYNFIGSLICTTHGCDTVQTSKWSTLFGLPVSAWGLGYYGLVFALTLAGIQDRFIASRRLTVGLLALTAWGAVFSGWLTYLEGYQIHAWCQWCIASATTAALLFLIALLDWIRTRDAAPTGSNEPS